jgi:hypothetical protein
VPLLRPPKPRAPLPAVRHYRLQRDVWHHVRGRYSSFIAHTGSCARPNPSFRLRLSLFQKVFAGCCQSLLGDGPSRRYLCNLSIGAWTLTPQCLFGASTRFFPKNISLTLDLRRWAHQTPPTMQLQQGHAFSRLQSFTNVQAPMVARPPGCTLR